MNREALHRAIEKRCKDLPMWRDVEVCIDGYMYGKRILWTRDVGASKRITCERLGFDHGSVTYGDPIDRIAWLLGMRPEVLAEHIGLDYTPGEYDYISTEEDAA